MKGMKLWVFTLLEYSAFGEATVLKSFVKPAQDSPVKKGKKFVPKKKQAKQTGVTELWEQ